GYDPIDTSSVDAPIPDFESTVTASVSALRLGIPRAYFYDELHPEIHSAMDAALALLKTLTASQQDIAPLASDATYSSWTQPYSAVFAAEAYAFHKGYIENSPELYQAATLKRLRAGAEITATKYIESRRQLEKVRRS